MTPSSTDIAYAAGLIDGEGTVSLKKGRRGAWRTPILCMSSTSRELVDFMQTTFGGWISVKKTMRRHHAPGWFWELHRDSALDALKALLPHIREPAKMRRIRMILDEYATTKAGSDEDRLDFEQRFFDGPIYRSPPD